MSSPSHTPNPSPPQSPSQSRSNHTAPPNQQPHAGGSAPSPSPSPSRGPSSRPPSHPATPNASQPSSRASSLSPSPHIQHSSRASPPNPTPPPSKSPSQSGLKSVSRNSSQSPSAPLTRSPFYSPAPSASYIGPARGFPSSIAPYVPRFLQEPPFFQPPTAPLPLSPCFARHSLAPGRASPAEPFCFPLLPPPPHHPRHTCSYPTPPSLFTPPSSLTYTPPIEVLVSARPHVVPSALPPTFYTPFSRYYSHPRPRRALSRRRPFTLSQYDSVGRSVHFF
ncbi:uncharacterized protein RBU33_004976, partial [Hipposideros larvatus]